MSTLANSVDTDEMLQTYIKALDLMVSGKNIFFSLLLIIFKSFNTQDRATFGPIMGN